MPNKGFRRTGMGVPFTRLEGQLDDEVEIAWAEETERRYQEALANPDMTEAAVRAFQRAGRSAVKSVDFHRAGHFRNDQSGSALRAASRVAWISFPASRRRTLRDCGAVRHRRHR